MSCRHVLGCSRSAFVSSPHAWLVWIRFNHPLLTETSTLACLSGTVRVARLTTRVQQPWPMEIRGNHSHSHCHGWPRLPACSTCDPEGKKNSHPLGRPESVGLSLSALFADFVSSLHAATSSPATSFSPASKRNDEHRVTNLSVGLGAVLVGPCGITNAITSPTTFLHDSPGSAQRHGSRSKADGLTRSQAEGR